jgi:hypothetical protein
LIALFTSAVAALVGAALLVDLAAGAFGAAPAAHVENAFVAGAAVGGGRAVAVGATGGDAHLPERWILSTLVVELEIILAAVVARRACLPVMLASAAPVLKAAQPWTAVDVLLTGLVESFALLALARIAAVWRIAGTTIRVDAADASWGHACALAGVLEAVAAAAFVRKHRVRTRALVG